MVCVISHLSRFYSPFLVSIIKGDGDGGLGDPCLPVLVDQLLEVGRPHVCQVGDPQQEADSVQDVTFPRTETFS